MGLLYTATSVSSYNANPPPDDGSTVATNLITWAGIKSKLSDPLNTFATSVDANITSAFNKTLDGANTVGTSVNYPAGASDQGRMIIANSSGITITTPDITSVGSPFVFQVNNQSAGTITIAGFGAQTIDNANTQSLAAGAGCIIRSSGSQWFTSGLKVAQAATGTPQLGFDMPLALQLNATVGSNLLTIAMKNNGGADPSVGNPVQIPFRDVTLANGDPVWVSVTSALSISTFATGATLGTQNSVPFRLWIAVFNNAGTPVLALWHSGAGAATPVINPVNEYGQASTTGISGAATSAGVWYTPNGTSLTNKAYRIIGFVTYETSLATAGTYAVGPDVVQLFGPGIPRPGEVVQTQFANTGSRAITPTSTANYIYVTACTSPTCTTSGAGSYGMAVQLKHSGGAVLCTSTFTAFGNAGGAVQTNLSAIGVDQPATTSSVTYNLNYVNTGAAGAMTGASERMTVQEIMA